MTTPAPSGAIELVHLCDLTITLRGAPMLLAGVPAGTLLVGEGEGGRLDGARVSGAQKGPATDWMTINGDGTGTLDARMTFETDDGAVIAVRYSGRADMSSGASVNVVAAPQFTTNDERYAWLNKIQAIAKGSRIEGGLHYAIYEVR